MNFRKFKTVEKASFGIGAILHFSDIHGAYYCCDSTIFLFFFFQPVLSSEALM